MADTPGPVDEDGDEVDPRVQIYNEKTGATRFGKKKHIKGLDDFARAPIDGSIPNHYSVSGWQMSDEAHPTGEGVPGYRLVHKLVRSVPFPMVNIEWANLRLHMGNGEVTWGEPRFAGSMTWRNAGSFLVPEWGRLDFPTDSPTAQYQFESNRQVNFEAHQETTPHTNYIEFLYHLPSGDWENFEDALAAGRAGVAPMTASIDLIFGERVLGPVITEEVGAIFDDWHWNRRLGGRTIAIEGQLFMQQLDGNQFAAKLMETVERQMESLTDDERTRLRVAAQWYWRAVGEADKVMKYLSFWLCVEALKLGENANIKPVKEAAAELLGRDIAEVAPIVNLLYRTRNALAHGKARSVSADVLGQVEVLARMFLEDGLVGTISGEHLKTFTAGLGYSPSPRSGNLDP